MNVRQDRPRVYLTYSVGPVRRFGLTVEERFESDSPADAAIWGTAIAETIQRRLQGQSNRPEVTLVIDLTTPTAQRYRTLLERAIGDAVRRLVGHLFASVVCQVRG